MNLVSRGRFSCLNEKVVKIGLDCISPKAHQSYHEVNNLVINGHYEDTYKKV